MSMLTFNPLNDYKGSLLRLLKAFESPHADARDVKDGKITIGLGFNLNAKDKVREAVINELLGATFQTSSGTPAQQAIEKNYAGQLDQTIQQTNLTVAQRVTQLNAIMAARAADTALNGYADNRRTTFTFSSNAAQLNTEVDRVFDVIRPLYETDLQRAFPAIAQGAGFIPGFANSREQAILFSFVYNGGTGLIGPSLKAAISSGDRARAWYEIRYQSNKLGWAQINGTADAAQQRQITSGVDYGLAKRRYFEAQVFGLYAGTTATQLEAHDAVRMLTEFRTEIFKYENAYGTRRDGSAGSRGDKVASAVADYGSVADLAVAQSLIAAFDPAKTTLLADLNSRYAGYAEQLTASNFLSTNIYLAKVGVVAQLDSARYETGVFTATNKNDLMIGDSKGDLLSGNGGNDVLFGEGGNDLLYGGAGSDLLIGGSDDDVLFGGAGDDTLVGGAGDDTYVIYLSDGPQHDAIVDSDGKGTLIIYGKDGTRLNTVILKRQDGSANSWSDADGQVTISHNSPWKITLADGSVIELGENFDPTGFGITLQDEAAVPTRTYLGDFIKKTEAGAPTRYALDANGNYVADGAQADADDVITGSADSDSMSGFGGNDALAGMNGDDLIDGGDGDDLLLGGVGADTLIGGAGMDYIFGGGIGALSYLSSTDSPQPAAPGPELTRGFSWVTYQSSNRTYSVLGGNALSVSDDAGNVLDGGAGDDTVLGAGGADVVHGGDDNDFLEGLGGNDVLFGDAGDDALSGDGMAVAGLYDTTLAPQHGDDILVGGAGNDFMVGGGADDELYGGTQNDTLYGDALNMDYAPLTVHGNDYLDGGDGADKLYGGGQDDQLFGGAGDDTLLGDDRADIVPGQYHGVDYLDGEDGNDSLEGGGKGDELFGGAGNDTLWGDASSAGLSNADNGADYLDGEAGDDLLAGGGGADTLFGGEGNDELQGDGPLIAEADGADDYLDGEAGNDTLYGNGGNDVLIGGEGDDHLSGGAGNDTLTGGAGTDALAGGAGDDTFVFNTGDGPINSNGFSESIDDNEGRNTVILDGVDLSQFLVRTDGQGQLVLDMSADDRLVIVGGVAGAKNVYQFGGTTTGATVNSQSGSAMRVADDELATASAVDAVTQAEVPAEASYAYNELVGQFAISSMVGVDALGHEHQLGGRGNDSLVANTASATLSGGRGNDVLRASHAPVGTRRSRRNGLALQGERQRRDDRQRIGASLQR